MTIKANAEVIRELKKARAEGKELNRWGREQLAEAEAKEKQGGGKTKIAAALYLLGASLRQVSAKLGITTSTSYTYVRDHLPENIRRMAGRQRDFGRSGPLIEMIGVDAYYQAFMENVDTLKPLSAIEIAAKLKQLVNVPAALPAESIEEETDEPY